MRPVRLLIFLALAACPESKPPPPQPKPRVMDLDAGTAPKPPSLVRPAPGAAELKKLDDGTVQLRGHTEPILAVAFDPSGKRAATAGMDRSIRVWDLEEGKQLWAAGPGDEAVTAVAFDASGETVAAGDRGFQVRLWKVKDGELLRRRPHPDQVSSLSFSPDGKWLAVAGASGETAVYPTGDEGPSKCDLRARSVAFSDGGKYLVSATATGAITATEFPACKKKKETSTAPHLPFGAASSKATLYATRNGAEAQVLLWDALGGRMLGKLDQQGAGVTSVSFSADGKRALVTSEDGKARLYDVDKREVLKTIEVGPVPFGAISQDGAKALLASGVEAKVVGL